MIKPGDTTVVEQPIAFRPTGTSDITGLDVFLQSQRTTVLASHLNQIQNLMDKLNDNSHIRQSFVPYVMSSEVHRHLTNGLAFLE